MISISTDGEVISFDSLSGVKQGDNLAPVLFLFVIQAVADRIDQTWDNTVEKPIFASSKRWRLTQREDAKKCLTEFSFSRLFYADDGSMIFTSRKDLILGTRTIVKAFADFGMEVHVGKTDAAGARHTSKTEFLFIPGDDLKSGELERAEADYLVFGTDFVSSCKAFKYLGSIISQDLTEGRRHRTSYPSLAKHAGTACKSTAQPTDLPTCPSQDLQTDCVDNTPLGLRIVGSEMRPSQKTPAIPPRCSADDPTNDALDPPGEKS